MQVRTVGISPKLIAAVISAVAAYLVTQTLLELPPWAILLSQVVVITVGVYLAQAGDVQVIDEGLEEHDLHDADGA